MTGFKGTFQGHTTGGLGGVTITGGGVIALVGAAVAASHPRQAAEALSGAVIAAGVTAGVVVLAVAAFVFLRLRGRGRNGVTACDAKAARPGIRWQQNPDAIPVPSRREIPAP